MALTNIFREPRREITETLIGVLVALPTSAAYLYASYFVGLWVLRSTPRGRAIGVGRVIDGLDMTLATMLGVCITMAAALVLLLIGFGIHALGEGVCNRLQEAGVHLRPRQRR